MVHQRIVAADAGAMARLAAEWLAGEIRLSATLRGACALCLAGGSTPRPVYEALAGPPLMTAIPWDRVRIFFGDERAVPPEDPRSNFRMVSEALIRPLGLSTGGVHRMEAEGGDLQQAADRYAALLPEALDILVLGIGADGHTASLFPGSEAVQERTRRVVAVRGPQAPEPRLTITSPVIRAARRVVVLAAGKDKADAVARAIKSGAPAEQVPARLARDGVWFLDQAAASRLAD